MAKDFVPWVVAAPSALLKRLGVGGTGLYAARGFKREDLIGQYPHDTVVGHYPTREAALGAPETQRLVEQGHDKLACVRVQGPGFLLLDGANGGPPFVQLCNDPLGTHLQPNAQLTDAGYLRVTQTRVRPFDTSKSLEENIHSELRISYGTAYWKHFGA